MSELRRVPHFISRAFSRSPNKSRRAQRHHQLRMEVLEHRQVLSATPITTLGAGTILTTNLPLTNQDGGENGQGVLYGTTYETPWAPQPNVTSYFTASGLPIQSSDWWSAVMFRTVNLGSQQDVGYAANPGYQLNTGTTTLTNVTINNLSYPLFADPLILQLDSSSTLGGGVTTFNPRGLAMGYASTFVNTGVNAPRQNTDAIITSNFNQDLLVGLVDHTSNPISAANLAVDNYSDWGATFAWSNGLSGSQAASITATAANGSPFTYFTTSGGQEVRIALTGQSAGPSLAYLSTDGRVAVVVVPNGPGGAVNANNVYALFAPVDGQWQYAPAAGATPATLSMQLTGANATSSYFSVGVLPSDAVYQQIDASNALLETFRQHAYAFILGPEATRDAQHATTPGTQLLQTEFNEATSTVTSTMGVTTRLMDTSDATLINGALLSLYPHQYKNLSTAVGNIAPLLDPSGEQYTYNSGKGTMRLYSSTGLGQQNSVQTTSFGTEMYYRGILPYLPNALTATDTATINQLIDYVHDVATGLADTKGLPFPGISENVNFISIDTNYPAGKHMLRVSLVLPIIDQLLAVTTDAGQIQQLTNDRITLLSQVQTALSSFFDVGGYQWLAYNSDWDTVIPYPDDNGTATSLNDKHFKWGYFLRSAALIARYNPEFISPENYGPILQLIARDAANWERDTTGAFALPFLRNFNPYAGHSWANGDAIGGNGNNQESSAEAINFAVGLIQFGEAYSAFDAATGKTIRDLGIYLFTTETEAIAQYYYNVDYDNYPDNFTLNYATVQTQAVVNPGDTQITLSGSGIPAGFPQGTTDRYRIRMDNEIMRVTARAGNVLTVLRGYDGSTPAAHAENSGLSLLDPFTMLAASIDASATTLEVTSNAGFPPVPHLGAIQFRLKIRIDSEIITVVGGAGETTWTLLRGQDGTTAAAHNAGASVILAGQVAPWGNLAAGVDNATTTIAFASSPVMQAFPDPNTTPFQIEIGGERMLVVAAPTATSWTVVRGYAGTIAAGHANGNRFRLMTREMSWTPPETALTSAIGGTTNTIAVDASSSTFGGFEVPNVVTTTAISGQLLAFSTTLAADITDTIDQVIDITVSDVSASIAVGAQFYITVGTGGTQSTFFVQNVSGSSLATWNVKRLGPGPYQTHSSGEVVTIIWPSGISVSDTTNFPTLILDKDHLPVLSSGFAPFDIMLGLDSYAVTATLGEANNIWQIGQYLSNTYSTGTMVYSGIPADSTVIAVASSEGFPTAGAFRILVGNEVMLVQERYFDTTTQAYLPNVWKVLRGYDGTAVGLHLSHSGVEITLLDPERAFTIQVGDERMRVLGQSAADTWTVLRGVDGTSAVGHSLGATVALAEVPPLTHVDITGRLFGSGPQKTTFFATPALDREAAFRVIQSLPISGASLYLGQYVNADGFPTVGAEIRALADFEQLLINAGIYPGSVNGGGLYPGTIWGFQALANASYALDNFNTFITNNYAYNVLVGTLAAEAVLAGANSVLVAPSNGVFVVPPDHTPVLVYFKVAFGSADGGDTLLVTQMQLSADAIGNSQFTGTRSDGVDQPLGQKVLPVEFSTTEQGNVTLSAALAWGEATVTVTDGADNPFPAVAAIGVEENVRFWVQVPVLVSGQTVIETWQVNSQTRNANGTRTWKITRQLVPLGQAVNVAAPTIAAGTKITPISAFLKINANSGLDEGESAANTYNFIQQLSKLGTPEPGYIATGAVEYAIFRNDAGQRTFAVYNSGSTPLANVNFYKINPDGSLPATAAWTFSSVAAGTFVWYSEATSQTTAETIPSLVVPSAENQFYLLNTQGNNLSNKPNGLSQGGSDSPGGTQTNLLLLPTTGQGNAEYTGGVSFVINNVTGTYDPSAANTKFQLFTVSGSSQTYSTSQPTTLESLMASLPQGAAYSAVVRVSYYAGSDTGSDAQPFRVELFNQSTYNNPNASSATNTYDAYTDAVGLKSHSGAYQNMSGGSIKVEVWLWNVNSTGAQNVGLKTSTPLHLDAQASMVQIPYTDISTTAPGISGTQSNQYMESHMLISPFSNVEITNPTNELLHVRITISDPSRLQFDPASVMAAGFKFESESVIVLEDNAAGGSGNASLTDAQLLKAWHPQQIGGLNDENQEPIVIHITVTRADGVTVTDSNTSIYITTTPPSDTTYVQSLYVKLLGRNAEMGGLEGWKSLLDAGGSRGEIVTQIWSSIEHRQFQVEELYNSLLGRVADPFGKQVWTQHLLNGASREEIIAQIISSQEFVARHSSNAELVQTIYQQLLGRKADALGLGQWSGMLDHGASVQSVVVQIMASSEYRAHQIEILCLKYIGREPTTREREFFFQRATTGLDSIAQMILQSDEFWAAQ